jgi:hypothetical protein
VIGQVGHGCPEIKPRAANLGQQRLLWLNPGVRACWPSAKLTGAQRRDCHSEQSEESQPRQKRRNEGNGADSHLEWNEGSTRSDFREEAQLRDLRFI